jgi:hypothetical protein
MEIIFGVQFDCDKKWTIESREIWYGVRSYLRAPDDFVLDTV